MTYVKRVLDTMLSEKINFMSPRHVRATVASTSSSSEKAESDSSFEHVAEIILEDESRVWNSIELF